MRGIGTWVLAGAVCALGLAAIVDSFIGGSEPSRTTSKPRPPTVSVDETAALRERLGRLGVRGTITYADTRCGIHTLRLPTLEESQTAFAPSCSFTVSPRNVWSTDASAIDPKTGAVAVCLQSGLVQVRAANGSTLDTGRGCPPAWTPDGTLTVVRDGTLVRLEQGPGGGLALRSVPVLTRADLARELARTPWGRGAPFAREAAWLTDDLVAVVVGGRNAGGDGLALFRGGRLVDAPLGPYGTLARVRPSPRGSYVSAVIADGTGLVVADMGGELVGVPIRSGQAIAWSPDEAFGLIASPGGTTLFEPPSAGSAVTQVVRLPIVARDIVWN